MRIERLTADLRTMLEDDRTLRVAGLRTAAQAGTPLPGNKGLAQDIAIIVVASAPLAPPAFRALANVIIAWCARDRRTAVRISEGNRSIEVTGDPSSSAGHPPHRFDWADQQPELWNVAVTRARSRLVIVGDAAVWERRGRIGGELLRAARHGVALPDGLDELGDRLFDVLAALPGRGAEFGVPVNGHRADAVLDVPGGPIPLLVDPSCAPSSDPAAHLRRSLHRAALLGDRAVRLPAWAIEQGPEEVGLLLRQRNVW